MLFQQRSSLLIVAGLGYRASRLLGILSHGKPSVTSAQEDDLNCTAAKVLISRVGK